MTMSKDFQFHEKFIFFLVLEADTDNLFHRKSNIFYFVAIETDARFSCLAQFISREIQCKSSRKIFRENSLYVEWFT